MGRSGDHMPLCDSAVSREASPSATSFSRGSFPATLNRPPDLVLLVAGCATRLAHTWCPVLPGWVSQLLLADLIAEHIYTKKGRSVPQMSDFAVSGKKHSN